MKTTLTVHTDLRGSVREAYRASWDPSIPPIVQMVHSESGPDVMRGIHSHKVQHDIWHFTAGEAFVQLYDPIKDSGETMWCGPGSTLIIPPGIAHGFYTPGGCTLIYLLTQEWDGTDEYEFDSLDPDFIGAGLWPEAEYVRSERDKKAPSFASWKASL